MPGCLTVDADVISILGKTKSNRLSSSKYTSVDPLGSIRGHKHTCPALSQ